MKRKSIPKSVSNIVFERDNWICQSCGVKVHNEPLIKHKEKRGHGLEQHRKYELEKKMNEPHNSHKACVDHIIPFVIGGSDEITNYQTLCFYCNSKKINKPYPQGFNIKMYNLIWDINFTHLYYIRDMERLGIKPKWRLQNYNESLNDFRNYIEEVKDINFISNWYGLFTIDQKQHFDKERWYCQHYYPVMINKEDTFDFISLKLEEAREC